MATIKPFNAAMFEPTKWDTAADKAEFANALARFIAEGFPQHLFTKKFYRRLSQTFGFIAHYDEHGFWAEYFRTKGDQARFLDDLLSRNGLGFGGDPAYTFSDVEQLVATWVEAGGYYEAAVAAANVAAEASERAELARLRDKYPEA